MIMNGTMRFFIDDGNLKSGEYDDNIPTSDEDYEVHLQLLDQMADIAIAAGKLECQLLLYEFMEAEVALKKTTSRKNALTPGLGKINEANDH